MREGCVAHSEAQRGEKGVRKVDCSKTDRTEGGPTEDLTWDSIVVPRLAKYYRTAVK